MFGLFNKQKKINVPPEMKAFASTFSIGQKASLITVLILIAKARGKISNKEINFIEHVCTLIDIDISHPLVSDAASSSEDARKQLADILFQLNSLERIQKEWVAFTMDGLLKMERSSTDKQVDFVIRFCQDMGISEEELINIVQRYEIK